MTGKQLWLDNARVWALPLGLLVVGTVGLAAYQVAFADRVGALRAQVERESGELDRLREQRDELEELVTRAERSRDGVQELYELHFATESERLTSLIREVKELAERSGLNPTSITYPEQALEDFGLIERAIVFSVDGTYRELRQFVNFLELSDSFVILRSIQLRGGSNELSLSLQLATLFTGRDAGEVPIERLEDAIDSFAPEAGEPGP
jgi:Tfp pilus assembly protein PilO